MKSTAQFQPPLHTRTEEEVADAEWARRQRLVENIANKQQQCRLIEDQGRLCLRRAGSARPLPPECSDLLKMQIACYGELLCGDLSDKAVECLRRNSGSAGGGEVACAQPLRQLKECVQPRLRPYKAAFRQEAARPAMACPSQAAKLDSCIAAAREAQPADPHAMLGKPVCPAELAELHECFSASVCPEPANALRECLARPARSSDSSAQGGTQPDPSLCMSEKRRLAQCMQDDALRSYARQGIPFVQLDKETP